MSSRCLASVHCSSTFTIFLSTSGELYSCGSHLEGALGQNKDSVPIPSKIPSLQNIIAISCGTNHSICLDNEGSVLTFGSNTKSQLGVTIKKKKRLFSQKLVKFTSTPQKVDLPPILQISSGDNFNVCLSEDRNLYIFGKIYYSKDCIQIPQRIESLENVDFVECGGNYIICKLLNNEIYAWGSNDECQIGFCECYVSEPTMPTRWPDNVVDIKCGKSHTLLLTSDGEVYSCGNNYDGQLGRLTCLDNEAMLVAIPELSEIIRIECGYDHSVCIDSNENIYMFGRNHYGQLGYETRCKKHPSLSNIIDISNGGWQTFVKTSNNEIYAFGYNKFSQLGIETEHEKQITPIRVFEDNEDIWFSNINKSKAKSARF